MENTSKYTSSAPSLQYLAGMKILQTFLLEFDVFEGEEICFHRDENFKDNAWFEGFYYKPLSKKVDDLPLPPLVKKELCAMIWNLTISLRTWLYRPMYEKTTTVSNEAPINFYHLKQIVFKTDGNIDEVETVKNVLHNGRLDTAGKFQLASEYCLEDELPEVTYDFRKNVDNDMFWKNMLMCFWYCHKYKKMELIAEFNCTNLSLPLLLMTTGALRNHHSLKYFWGQLNYEEKVRGVTSLISNKIKPELYMLNELREEDLRNFYFKLASHIERLDADVHLHKEFLLPMWSRIKDALPMSSCYEIFLNISDHMTWSLDLQNLVTEMWHLTSDEMKEYLLEKDCLLVGRQFLQRGVFHKFIKILFDSTNNLRKKLIESPSGQRFCQDLLYFNLPKELQVFMYYCLPDTEVGELKKKLIAEDMFGYRLSTS